MLTPQQRSMRARAGGFALAAKYDPKETTKPARATFLARFEREVDPENTLSAAERIRRAEALRKSYFTRLSLRSSIARKATAAALRSQATQADLQEARELLRRAAKVAGLMAIVFDEDAGPAATAEMLGLGELQA